MEKTAAGWTRFESASDRSLLIHFDDRITLQAHHKVTKLVRLLEAEPIPGISNLHPAYCSLLVVYDALQWQPSDLEAALRQYLARLEDVPDPEPRLIEIPACYGGELGPDLDDVASIHGMTRAEVIELHASATYMVYFIGFVPGFAYLGGLPGSLATPRLATPRRSVPAGSIAIGGDQTAIYPISTPGGWRLIGRTPLTMFNPHRRGDANQHVEPETMSLLSIGDHVRFHPVSTAEYSIELTRT